MYVYDEFDSTFIAERAAEFRGQVARRLSGELTEDEFKPLRLMNGVYLQLHAYMLRIAVPYGTLSANQLRKLAHVARVYDRGYGHFTTRQNLQLNWIKLSDVPDAIEELASAGIHAIQTSGNCIRNITTDQWAGVAPDEIEDPRLWAEILRQWSALHPEFTFLPRKFKIAITAAPHDRAAVKVHDIGLRMIANASGEIGFEVSVGGGLGRSPFIGKVIRDFLPKQDLLSYLEAVLRIYNAYGRRDNIYKARVKFLVHDLGVERFAAEVEEEWARIKDSYLKLDPALIADIRSRFVYPEYEELEDEPEALRAALKARCPLRAVAPERGGEAQGAGLRHRDAFAEAHRQATGRRHLGTDGGHSGPCRPLQPWRGPRGPRAEPGVPACAPAGPAGALEAA